MMEKIKRDEIWSIPNCMGYFRILLIPIFCIVYLKADSMKDYYVAAGIVLVSTITDFFDGKVARKFNMVTELGKFVDPLADKLTHGAVALCLCTRYQRMLWLVILMIVKEGFMAVMGLINLRHGKKLDGAKWYGKVCTATLFVVLGVLVFMPKISGEVANILILGEMIIMAIVLVLYAFEFQKMAK